MLVESKKYEVRKVEKDILFYKRIEKGKTPVYVAHVKGKGEQFPLDLEFLRGEKAGHIEGFGYGVVIPLEIDETYLVGHSGENWKEFFTVNKLGFVMTLSRQQVYESLGIPWQEDYQGGQRGA